MNELHTMQVNNLAEAFSLVASFALRSVTSSATVQQRSRELDQLKQTLANKGIDFDCKSFVELALLTPQEIEQFPTNEEQAFGMSTGTIEISNRGHFNQSVHFSARPNILTANFRTPTFRDDRIRDNESNLDPTDKAFCDQLEKLNLNAKMGNFQPYSKSRHNSQPVADLASFG